MSGRVTFLFHHQPGHFYSDIVAWATRADVTHVAMLDPVDGSRVLEASSVGSPKGVRVVPFAAWVAKHPGYKMRYVMDPDPVQIWNIGCQKVGCGYDWLYVFGWWLRLRIQDPKKFVCQEIIDWPFRVAGRPLFDTTRPHFLTPQNLYNISTRL